MTHRSHERWSAKEDQNLVDRFRRGSYPFEIAKAFGRTELAIRGRLAKFNLLPPVSAEDIKKFGALRSQETKPNDPGSFSALKENAAINHETDPSKIFEATLDVQQAFHRFHFVYGIVNPNGKVYVGYSQDVWHRIAQHNRDLGAVATRNAGPWFPFAIYCFAAEFDARSMETYIRSDFVAFAVRVEISLREVLAQIGVPILLTQLELL